MDEKVTLYRDINSGKEGSDPVYQRWFPKTVDEAVVMTDEEDSTLETNLKTRMEQLKQEIADMEAEASALKKATETLKSTTDSLKSATDTLKSTTDTIQSDVTKVKSDITNINGNLNKKLNKTELNSKSIEVAVESPDKQTEITEMAGEGGRWIPVIVGHGSKIHSIATVSFDGSKWYISATLAQMYRIVFYKYPSA